MYNLHIIIFLDVDNKFKALNPKLPKNSILRTFLLRDNHVVLCGNPTGNKNIKQLYKREMNQL